MSTADSRSAAWSSSVADQPMLISRQSLDRALSLTQSQRSRPSRCPVSARGPDVPLSLNTLKLFEAAASLAGPIQATQWGISSLPKPALTGPLEEILIEVGDVFPSGSSCHQPMALGTGCCRDDPDIPESGHGHGAALCDKAPGTGMAGVFWLPLDHELL